MPDRQPANLLQWGSLGSSGAAIVLLVTSLNMQGDQARQFTALRHEVQEIASKQHTTETHVDLQLVRMRNLVNQLTDDVSYLKRLEQDPSARPDAWTRSDDSETMREFRLEMTALFREQFEAERLRWVGHGGPLHLQQLLDIQRAIEEIPTDDPDGWNDDGSPSVRAVSRRFGGAVSKKNVDRASILMDAARNLKP